MTDITLLGNDQDYAARVVDAFNIIDPKKIGHFEIVHALYVDATRLAKSDRERQIMHVLGIAIEFYKIAKEDPREGMLFFKQAVFADVPQCNMLAPVFRHVWDYTHGADFILIRNSLSYPHREQPLRHL
jgi:hypothetical protein